MYNGNVYRTQMTIMTQVKTGGKGIPNLQIT